MPSGGKARNLSVVMVREHKMKLLAATQSHVCRRKQMNPVHPDVPTGGKVVMVKPRPEYANPCVRSVPIGGIARGVSVDMSARGKVVTVQLKLRQ